MTRRDLVGLAPVLHDVVIHRDGACILRLTPDLEIPLTNSGGAIRSFVAGWQPGLMLTMFAPVLLLEFRHESDHGSFWLIDADGRFLGNDFAQLPPHLLETVRSRAAPALAWLVDAASHGSLGAAPPSVEALLAAHLHTRRQIARLVFGTNDPRTADRLLELADDVPSPGPWERPAELQVRQGDSVLEPGPGWRIDNVQTLFAPVFILQLMHEDGHQGVWYVDRAANFLGNSAMQLQGGNRERVAAACAVLFADLWERVIVAPSLPVGPELQELFGLASSTRTDLANFHLFCTGKDARAQAWHLDETLPRSMSYTVPAGDGQVILDPAHTRRACQQFLRTELFRDVTSGMMSWPSPVDGRDFCVVSRTLYFDDLCFAYQVHDERHDLTFYALATAGFFRTFALYFPTADLIVAQDATHLAAVRAYGETAAKTLLQHVARFGHDLMGALLQGPVETVHAFRGYAAIHLGHFVWQDLSGISYLVDAFQPERLPRFYVFDTEHHPEMYGPIDEIFPELAGKVVRVPGSFNAHIATFYRERQNVIKSTGISVPAQVGTRIIGALRRSRLWTVPVAEAARARAAGPVVLIGLRIGNRTIEDMEGFVARLIRMLIDTLGPLTVVIDGHNSAGDRPGTTYASFGDTLSGGSTFLQREREIADAVARLFAEAPVRIIDIIGRPIAESVIWCSEADFFVAPWGAGLAKYRWVCNTPGLTTVGRWNLEHRGDLAIYHSPHAMQDPTPLEFTAVDAVEDLIEDDDPGKIDRCNYRLDETKVHAQIRDLAARCCRPRAGTLPDTLPAALAAVP